MASRSELPVAILVGLLGALGALGAGVSSCAVQRGEAIPVTTDSIGSLRLDGPLGDLKDRTPGARDTTIDVGGSRAAGVVFRFPYLTVVAMQRQDTLDPRRPADRWTITGCGGLVRNEVPVCANWQELTRAFGDSGVGTTASGPAMVRLCELPGFEFELDVGRGTVGSLETASDLSRIPASARIERITVSRDSSKTC